MEKSLIVARLFQIFLNLTRLTSTNNTRDLTLLQLRIFIIIISLTTSYFLQAQLTICQFNSAFNLNFILSRHIQYY